MNRLTALLLGSAAAVAATAAPVCAQQKAPLSILRVIDADNYDPIRSTSTAAAEALYMLADTLVSVDFDMKTIKPGLAESWTVSPDGATYTFKLRTDVKFCDGRPMTAEDVVYSLKRWTDPANKSPVSFRGGQVKDIRAEGDATVVYELKEPYSDLLFQIGLSFASVVDKNAVEKLGANFGVQGFNATGPYCWVKWTPRQELVMKKNPHYTWGPPIYKDPKPQIDEIVWKIIPESNTLMAAIQAKQADVTYYMPYIALDTMQRMPGMQVQRQDNYIYDIFMGFKGFAGALQFLALRVHADPASGCRGGAGLRARRLFRAMISRTRARSAPSTETRRASGLALTLAPGIELSMALLMVPAQWPQVISSTRTETPETAAEAISWS